MNEAKVIRIDGGAIIISVVDEEVANNIGFHAEKAKMGHRLKYREYDDAVINALRQAGFKWVTPAKPRKKSRGRPKKEDG